MLGKDGQSGYHSKKVEVNFNFDIICFTSCLN